MEPITIVVPVLGRPQNAEPFVASLHDSKAADVVHEVIVVTSKSDEETWDAWSVAGLPRSYGVEEIAMLVVPDEQGSFACKVNRAAEVVASPWMFLVGDDVRFHEYWAQIALAATYGTDVCVVGTNDLGTPAVRSGEHATHMLIRTDYVREQGASWDGPGVVAHEGYHHWFVDNEIVTVAKLRGVWTAASGSVVEHMHPYFGRGQMDDTYRLGEAEAQQDGERWLERVRRYAPQLLEQEGS